MLPDFPAGTLVRFNARGLRLQRKLTQHGGAGMVFADSSLSSAEAAGTFEWLGTDDGRNAFVRSVVSGREGELDRSMLRKA